MLKCVLLFQHHVSQRAVLTEISFGQVISMASDALESLGIKHKTALELNSLGDAERYLLGHILNNCAWTCQLNECDECSRANYRVALEEYFGKRKQDLSADSVSRYDTMWTPGSMNID